MSDVKPVLVYVVDQLFEFSDKAVNYPFASTSGLTRLGGEEDMSLILDASRVECLISFVDHCVQRDGCDHSHRFTQEWSRREAVNWDDLLDILEANGAFCDCEVVLNLPEDMDLHSPAEAAPGERGNPWLLPPAFKCDESAAFTKVIVCQIGLGRNIYGTEGEWLVPAPKGVKPRRRVRKSMNFFIGYQSGMPSEVGVVAECREISAMEFAKKVAQSGFEELANFTFREAGFVLSRVASLKPGMPVATHFADQIGIASRHEELRVHRVIIAR